MVLMVEQVVQKIKVAPTSFSTGYYKKDHVGGDFGSPENESKSGISHKSSSEKSSRVIRHGNSFNNDFPDEFEALNDSVTSAHSQEFIGNSFPNDGLPSTEARERFDKSSMQSKRFDQGLTTPEDRSASPHEAGDELEGVSQVESTTAAKLEDHLADETPKADDFSDFPDPPASWDEAETESEVPTQEEPTNPLPDAEAVQSVAESSAEPVQEEFSEATQDDPKAEGDLESPCRDLVSSNVESSAESYQEDHSQLDVEREADARMDANENEFVQTSPDEDASPVDGERESLNEFIDSSAADTTDNRPLVAQEETEDFKNSLSSPARQSQRVGCALCRGNEEALKEALRRSQEVTSERDSLASEMSRVKTELKQLQEALARKGTQYQEEIEKQEALEVEVQEKEGFIQQLRKELNTLRDSKADSSTVSQQLKDSESAREQLMDEGRRLMTEKQSLEKIIKGLRKQLKDREKDEERYKEGKAAEEARKKAYEERLAGLGEQVQNSKMQNEKLMAECSDLRKKLQAKEKEIGQHVKKIADLERTVKDTLKCNEDLARKLEDVASDAQTDARRAVEKEKKAYEKDAEEKIEMLSDSLESMQAAMRRLEAQSNSKEQRLRAELEDVQQRCREAEERVLELTSSVPDATRPLLRQIESLQVTCWTSRGWMRDLSEWQTSFVDKQRIWEQLEKTLRQRWYCQLLCSSNTHSLVSSDAEAEARQAVEREKVLYSRRSGERVGEGRRAEERRLTCRRSQQIASRPSRRA
eukprot:753314-Hanusia_phi.AAC.5